MIKSEEDKSTFIKKGFSHFKQVSLQNTSLLYRIQSVGDKITQLSNTDKKIVKKIILSYKKNELGKPLNEEDYILSGHEIAEFNRLGDGDICRYLSYRYRYNKYPELHIAGDYPPCIQIEPSSICNYRCKMCYQTDNSFSNKNSGYMGYMSYELYKDVIDQISGNIEGVTLASRGEPLLNKNILKMIEYSSRKFLGFKVNTNASLLTEKLCHGILDNMYMGTIVFSLETTDADMYKKIRIRGSLDNVVEKISMFKRIKEKYYKDSKIIVRISGVKQSLSSSAEEMEAFWSLYADQISLTNCMPWNGFYSNKTNDLTMPCSDLWRRMFVWHDGTVNPCDNDYKSMLSVGNVKNSSITSLWNSEKYEGLRRIHLSSQRGANYPCSLCESV